jgi:biotin carboxylase
VPGKTHVLVVGTTADYIDWIRNSYPEQALFLTEPHVRRQAKEPCPSPTEEILCSLDDDSHCRQLLDQHLKRYGFSLDGVACFDCESMELAARLARHYQLPYPSVAAVNNCHSKDVAKRLWRSHHLQTPKARAVGTREEAVAFFEELGSACVLKPICGSGSEFVYYCDSPRSCGQNFELIRQGLARRRNDPLYKHLPVDGPQILVEEYIAGDEYSCDFLLENQSAQIIRLTRKIVSSDSAFGTARGYLLTSAVPAPIGSIDRLHDVLYRSATALGLARAICMLDFMIFEGRVVLLELAPRPGGDCLPFLLRRGCDLDILKLFLDFCRQRPLQWKPFSDSRAFLAMRLHADRSGILRKIDRQRLEQDARVREIHLTRQPGHRIKMPPQDYDSWLLGHIIFEPDVADTVEAQCLALLDKLIVEVE